MTEASARIRAESMQHYGFGPEAMKRIKVCGQCGASAEAAERYCKDCGSRLPEQTLFDLYKGSHPYCRICNTVIADSAHFCPKCGAKIKYMSTEKDKEE